MLGQLNRVIKATGKSNTPVELILKDISTVGNRPDVLDEWAKAVMSIVDK